MRKIIHQGKYLTMSTEEIDGHLYERVTMRPGLAILPVKNDKILFIKEYRTHEKKSSLKLISGWVDKEDKTTLETAQEELREEASMEAEKWELFYEYNTTNFTIEEKKSYFIAENLQKLPPQKNPDTNLVEEIVFLNEKEIKEKLLTKELLWSKDFLVVLMYFEEKKLKKENE